MPDVHDTTTDPRTLVDRDRRRALAAVVEQHRTLLAPAAEEHRRRVAQRVSVLAPGHRALYLDEAERLIAALMIDPQRHAALELDAYRAIRDGIPMAFEAATARYMLRRPDRPPLAIHPGMAEHRLGTIARSAARGLALEQIHVVALTTAQMAAPHEATHTPTELPVVRRGGTGSSIRRAQG
ncbi:hypothetical protein D5S18_31840 [Nocardia panacis]|uniref:Uncharacterized protein n=1 Tax=Nocardia panacis TaxID=2340916 RepID=A0A3A4KJ93_9NOCA|nr:hypothetical protein [Nocardia panacis]RJO69243.1 hypothetical protein D5S18_31840 [Nocardia panacis]